MNIDLALQLLLALATRTQEIGNLIAQARAEGRDLTSDELDQLAVKDDTARAELDAAIAAAKQA